MLVCGNGGWLGMCWTFCIPGVARGRAVARATFTMPDKPDVPIWTGELRPVSVVCVAGQVGLELRKGDQE